MNKKISILTLLLSFTIFSTHAQEEIGYFIKKEDNSKLKLYLKEIPKKDKDNESQIKYHIEHSVETDGMYLYYYDENKKKNKIAHKSLKELFIGNTYYVILPLYKSGGMPRLQRLIATNEKGYKLTEFIQSDFYIIYAFDDNDNILSKTTCAGSGLTYDHINGKAYKIDDKETIQILESIDKYFSGCPELRQQIIDAAEYNKDKKKKTLYLGRPFLNNINNLKCE